MLLGFTNLINCCVCNVIRSKKFHHIESSQTWQFVINFLLKFYSLVNADQPTHCEWIQFNLRLHRLHHLSVLQCLHCHFLGCRRLRVLALQQVSEYFLADQALHSPLLCRCQSVVVDPPEQCVSQLTVSMLAAQESDDLFLVLQVSHLHSFWASSVYPLAASKLVLLFHLRLRHRQLLDSNPVLEPLMLLPPPHSEPLRPHQRQQNLFEMNKEIIIYWLVSCFNWRWEWNEVKVTQWRLLEMSWYHST